MAQIETTRLRRVFPHVLPIVPPIAATLLIVLQQTYYQGTHAETHINIILLVLSLLDFLPMLRKQTGDLQALHLSCVGYIDILACLYNVSIVGIPSPLSDFPAFLNSFCGIWLLAAVAELGVVIGPLIYKNHRERLAREEGFSSARQPKDPDPNMEENGTGPTRTGQPFSKEDTFVSGGATAQPGSEPRGSGPQRRRRRFSLTSRTAPLLFVFLAVLLPLIPWESASAWYTSVKEIAVTVYGSWLEDNSPVTIVLLYVAMLFAIFMTLYILYLLSVYMLDRIKYRPGAGGDIFEEYSSAIALLVVAGTGALAIHHFSGDDQFSEIAAVGNLFQWMLVVIVGLITVFVLFETVRLVLHQCLERGTLLKTAMHLVFVLIVQYTMGLLTGILRVFAIRDVIESILLFFMPDLEDSIEPKLNTQIPAAQSATERARDIWDDAEDRLENPTLGADMEDLETAYRQAQENYNRASTYEMELQSDLEDYQEAQRVIQRYLSYLGFSSDNTGLQIESALRTIQRGLLLGGSDATDLDELEKQAVLIFEQLQSDEDGLDVGDSSEYQTMLNDMDRFIREIQDYISVRTVGQNLDAMISDLQSIGQTSQDWKTEWAERLNTLKATIGSLPTYTEGDSAFLRRYERTEAIENLDNELRLYLSDHNAADQAIIYLNCPYRGLAVFSLLLAFFLDIAAFITGFIIDAADKRRENKSQSEPAPLELPPDETVITPATERRYLYLTGDYGKERNVYYYQGMEGAYEVEVELTDGSLTSGFYEERHGELLPVSPQALALSLMPGGPRDGIYRDCALRYQDHMLSIKGAPEKEFRYLATVDDETPVYRMRQGGCISETVRDIRAESWKTVILALNSGGTLVSAIFLEEEIPPKAGRNHIR